MTDLRKAAEQALEALGGIHPGNMTPMAEESWNKAAEALRQALAQTEQEPVAYLDEGLGAFYWPIQYEKDVGFTPLYAVPPHRWSNVTDDALMQEVRRRGFVIRDATVGRKWVGLTDDEIYDYADKFLYQHGSNYGIKSFGKAIEDKLKEKNT